MAQMIKLVFADYRYIILAAAIFVGMVIPLSIISEFIFLEPYIIADIPSGGEISFFLILVATAFLANYEIPIRLVAIAILAYTYYATVKSLAVECKINT